MREMKKIIDYLYMRLRGVDTKYGFVQLNGFPVIVKNRGARISIGKGVTINSSIYSNIAGINHRTILAAVGDGAQIIISDNCGLSGATIVSVKNVFLDFYVGMGVNSAIYDTDFHPISWDERKVQRSIADAQSQPVSIGEGTLLGMNSVVLKGVSIGKHSFIGACSVVTHSMGDGVLVAGNPAKEVRKIE